LDFEELLLTQRQLLILGICQPLRLIGIWTLLEEQIKSPGLPHRDKTHKGGEKSHSG